MSVCGSGSECGFLCVYMNVCVVEWRVMKSELEMLVRERDREDNRERERKRESFGSHRGAVKPEHFLPSPNQSSLDDLEKGAGSAAVNSTRRYRPSSTAGE